MPSFTADIDFSVYCARCGAGLCGNCTTDDKRMRMDIEPCDKCLDSKYDEGREDGRQEAK